MSKFCAKICKIVHFFYFTPTGASALMDKYVTSYYIMLRMCTPFFKNHSLPSNPPNLGGLQICGPKGNDYISSHFSSLPLSSSLSKHTVKGVKNDKT